MRTTYIVCYDIADAKRLRRVFKICRNYGNHLQFSVFECELSQAEKIELERKLGEIMNFKEDQALFIALGPSDGRGDRVITALGLPYTHFDSHCYVV
jgi:CRISPR-associated protein Cas2